MMNVGRFTGLPNALKPAMLVIILLTMIIVAASHSEKGSQLGGSWFFWLTIICQLVFMSLTCGLFLFEAEALLTCGRDSWPVFEMSYSIVFASCNAISMFIVAGWTRVGSASYIVGALLLFALVILYGLSAVMMFRIWRGFVQSGASQNPTAEVQPGNIGAMNPGL